MVRWAQNHTGAARRNRVFIDYQKNIRLNAAAKLSRNYGHSRYTNDTIVEANRDAVLESAVT
jgi:hypothetical protein